MFAKIRALKYRIIQASALILCRGVIYKTCKILLILKTGKTGSHKALLDGETNSHEGTRSTNPALILSSIEERQDSSLGRSLFNLESELRVL